MKVNFIKTLALVVSIIGAVFSSKSQNTVGLLSIEHEDVYEGYSLFFPHNQSSVYLIDNCGEIVHEWADSSNFRPGNIAYIDNEGNLTKGKRDAALAGDHIWAGGGGSIIERRSWDNELIWEFEMNDSLQRIHHDFSVMPNGNVLAIAWELKSEEDAQAAGRDTSTTAQDKLWPDFIFELNGDDGEIVWEWHAWDHLIQDFDSSKANYGSVYDHPELININYDNTKGHPDWLHANSIDYNEDLDQIMISVPTFNEIWIIDHSTTTQQAAGHLGGFADKGGDLLFRWGNPLAHAAGDSSDQKLFYQHDAHWINDFLDDSHSEYGKIAVFNNRVNENVSTAHVIMPEWVDYEWAYSSDDNVFLPNDFSKTYRHPVSDSLMYSNILSSIQHLPNDNVLLGVGRPGYAFELNSANEVVWEYRTPLVAGSPVNQGDAIALSQNLTFRIKKYPLDFEGFKDRDLSPKGYIELNPDVNFCEGLNTSVFDNEDKGDLIVYPNPVSDILNIEGLNAENLSLAVYNARGMKIGDYELTNTTLRIAIKNWDPGVYFVTAGAFSRKVYIKP